VHDLQALVRTLSGVVNKITNIIPNSSPATDIAVTSNCAGISRHHHTADSTEHGSTCCCWAVDEDALDINVILNSSSEVCSCTSVCCHNSLSTQTLVVLPDFFVMIYIHLLCIYGFKICACLLSIRRVDGHMLVIVLMYQLLIDWPAHSIDYILPFSALTLLAGCQEEHPACKN